MTVTAAAAAAGRAGCEKAEPRHGAGSRVPSHVEVDSPAGSAEPGLPVQVGRAGPAPGRAGPQPEEGPGFNISELLVRFQVEFGVTPGPAVPAALSASGTDS